MIRRNSKGQSTPSLVNDASNEHLNIAEGIRTDVPITNLKSVVKSINFVNDQDGSYTLRAPLILKERISENSWYLYDRKHILNFDDGILTITNVEDEQEVVSITFRYFDKEIKLNKVLFVSNADRTLSFVNKIISVTSLNDYTLMSFKLNIDDFADYITSLNTAHSSTLSTEIVYSRNNYSDLDNGNLYRLFKIYQNTEDLGTNNWILELVNPELNSFTSSTGVESLETNLLLDNPYAVRDLYGYGYMSTTKILTYIPQRYSFAEINTHPVYKLTESVLDSEGYGYKLLISSSPFAIGSNAVILKAFLTTAKTNGVYYCIWEQSSNGGIDWEPCPEFISKFENNQTNPLVTTYVSDLTSAEFDKLAYQESLDQAANYLVEKQVVRLNYKRTGNSPDDLSQEDLIAVRPDVLILQTPDLSKKYRFQVYVDTLKDSPTADTLDKTYTAYAFTSINGDFDPDFATYDATNYNYGYKYDTSTTAYSLTRADVLENSIVLYPAENGINTEPYQSSLPNTYTYYGSGMKVSCQERTTNSKIKQICVTVSKNDCKLAFYYYDGSGYYTKLKSVSKNSTLIIDASEFSHVDKLQEFYIYNAGARNTDNSTVAYISKIKIVYEIDSTIESTSVYLSSSTGEFQIPYTETTVFAESLVNERNNLFNGKYFEYENQLLTFNKYSLFISDLDSMIFGISKEILFSTEIVNLLKWRSYLLVFTEKDITLLKYDYNTDDYTVKLLSTSIGVPKEDANTVTCILNSVYFKSGYKVYKLVPNLYASNDDILNLHSVSDQIDKLIENLLSSEIQTGNFVFVNAYHYYLFVPILNKGFTYCFVFDYTNKIWNLYKYPTVILSVENLGLNKEYLKTESGIYYFKDNLKTLLNEELVYNSEDIGFEENSEVFSLVGDAEYSLAITGDQYETLIKLFPQLPHMDFLTTTLKEVYYFLETHTVTISNNDTRIEDSYDSSNYIQMTPIEFLIDFGQKSSNYTIFKGFLETKITLATLSEKDVFPFEVSIATDGMYNNALHWDVTTDSALWRDSLNQKGTVGTYFTSNNSEYDGIIRQLIIKYSSKGKTIHHLISGLSKTNFKFYSMDVRSRILPKKI